MTIFVLFHFGDYIGSFTTKEKAILKKKEEIKKGQWADGYEIMEDTVQ